MVVVAVADLDVAYELFSQGGFSPVCVFAHDISKCNCGENFFHSDCTCTVSVQCVFADVILNLLSG